VSEQEFLTLRPDEKTRHEAPQIVLWLIKKLRHDIAAEALAQHGSCLKGYLVRRIKPVQPPLHEALHCAWDSHIGGFLRLKEKVLQKERVAASPLYTSLDQAHFRSGVRYGEVTSLFGPQ
jgi:hypothetical protein